MVCLQVPLLSFGDVYEHNTMGESLKRSLRWQPFLITPSYNNLPNPKSLFRDGELVVSIIRMEASSASSLPCAESECFAAARAPDE